MPIVELHVLAGYDSMEKQRLGEALTDAVRFVVPASPDLVTVMIHDMLSENYYRGSTTRAPAQARPDPAALVKSFMTAMETRDIDAAQELLGKEFIMNFPAVPPMSAVQEMVDWAKPRYRFVKKTFEGFDAMQGAGDQAIVYCRGTLSGEWPDGTAFDGIRFIDRFEITDGKITRQDVWNDIAEEKAQK